MGGVFNYVNLHVYHYAGNNPINYIDPNGLAGSFPDGSPEQDAQWEKIHGPDITVAIQRVHESYSTTGGRNTDSRGKDIMTVTNNRTDESISIPVTTVPNMGNIPIEDALAPGDIELTLGPESTNQSRYAPDVLTVSGGQLISGETLNSDGTTENNKVPWRGHDTRYWGSEGCITGQANNPSGNIKTFIAKLRSWGVKYGTRMQGRLTNNNNSVYGRMK
jgi:hypothetical protein